eukprot:gb/GEZJ01004491.1/.p2 GENE.gb/GEZJ01004491.1/~~gb/GEZJ01004491.1/.p2  ORF type:complete len:125 (-),score=19.99 gb/GEZJ01004491.1/:452-826(-)
MERKYSSIVSRASSVHPETFLHHMAMRRRPMYLLKTVEIGAAGNPCQNRAKKAPMKKKTMSRVRYPLATFIFYISSRVKNPLQFRVLFDDMETSMNRLCAGECASKEAIMGFDLIKIEVRTEKN